MEHKPISAHSIALGVLALCFLAGITGGCLLSARGGAAADSAVTDYLSPLAQGVVSQPSVGRALLDAFLYPAICFVLGFAIPGVVLIPVTVTARGFFLAYAVASCARVFGAMNGVLVSFALIGLPLLLSLPCLFLLGSQGLLGSYALLRTALRTPAPPVADRKSFARFGVSLCALTAAAASEIFICPLLASIVATRL